MSTNQDIFSAGKSTARPLSAVIAGVSSAGAVLTLEALALHWLDSPARPLDSMGQALCFSLCAGILLGLISLVVARGKAASDRVRFGLPLSLLVPLVLAVHLRDFLLSPGDGLLSPKNLALFGSAALVALVAATIVVRGSRGPGGSRAPTALFACMLAVSGTWGLVGGFRSGATSADGPNVVLVVFDTTRVDRLSAFGYHRDTTPVLSDFARGGAKFTRCYAAAPWTVPSHASMFTGEQTSTHKATRQRPILDSRLPTLAEKMQASGFHTVSFSKKSWLSSETGLLRGFEEINDLHNPGGEYALAWLVGQFSAPVNVLDKGATGIVRLAANWLEEHAEDQPFFAFFNFNEAHSDLRPPRRYREMFLEKADHASEWGRTRVAKNHDFSVGAVSYSEEELALISDLYDAEIAYQDACFGELLEAFRSAGVLDNTLFLVTADHGENLGEHGLLGHEMSLHGTLLHVPLVARWPGHIEAGLTVDAPVENRLMGRLIESLLANSGEANAEGLAAALRNPAHTGIVSEEFAPNFKSSKWGFAVDERFDFIRKTLVEGDLKLSFESRSEFPALFDLLGDPQELTDIAQVRQEQTEAFLKNLLEREDLWQEIESSGVEFSDDMQDRLNQMGY